MTDHPDDADSPHITIEFVGGPFCGVVADSQEQQFRASVLRRLLASAWSDRPAELRLQQVCSRRSSMKAGRDHETTVDMGRERLHRYRLLVELAFGSRVLFRAEHAGTETA